MFEGISHHNICLHDAQQGSPGQPELLRQQSGVRPCRLGSLLELSRLLLAAGYDEVPDIAVRKGADLTGSDGCCLIIETRKGELIQKAGFPAEHFELQQAISPECADFLKGIITKGEGILSLVTPWNNGNAWYHELLPSREGSPQLICMPLFFKGASLGLMIFYFGTRHDRPIFSAESIENLKSLCMLVAAAIGAAYAKKRCDKEMAHREHLSTLGENSACIAHTIRNSLTSIGGFARRLGDKLSAEESCSEQVAQARQYAAIISGEVAKLESITKSVLTYARFSTQQLHLASCNIHAYLSDLVSRFGERYPSVTFECDHDRHNVTIPLDMAAMETCLDDLVRNAVEARAGVVHIKTKIKPRDKRLLIAISNDGEEISPTILDKIFDPFMTTKVDGTGLGLANVQAIVSAHGGKVSVRNNTIGTEFNIFLSIS